MSNNLQGIMEAYKQMVSEQAVDESLSGTINKKLNKDKKDQEDAKAKISAKGGVIGKKGSGVSMKEEDELDEKKLDPVGKEDDDVDNDGDTDSSDKYLKNRRKKVSKSIKQDDEAEDDGKAEISKIESVKESIEDQLTAMFAEIAESIDLSEKKDSHKKDATAPEEIDSKESPKSKEFIDQHKKSDKKVEDAEEDGHTKTFKAGGKDMKQAPNRGNDNLSNGDKTPVKGK